MPMQNGKLKEVVEIESIKLKNKRSEVYKLCHKIQQNGHGAHQSNGNGSGNGEDHKEVLLPLCDFDDYDTKTN